ncbi:MAG: hypothetical protein GY740_02715 [Gammaproteobacteria bacterium]|nr:hypothetical protein [Gammaproteobacteria bacterium]
MHTNNKKKLFDSYNKKNDNKFQNKVLKLNFQKKNNFLTNNLNKTKNLNNKLNLLSFLNKRYTLSQKNFNFRNKQINILNYDIKKDSLLFFYKKNKLNLLINNKKFINNNLNINKSLLNINNVFNLNFLRSIKKHNIIYKNLINQKYNNINLNFYIIYFFYKNFLKFNINNYLKTKNLNNDKYIIKLILILLNEKLSNKYIQFKFKEKNNFLTIFFINLIKKTFINTIQYNKLFTNNLFKLHNLLVKSDNNINYININKNFDKYLNYKKQYDNHINKKLIFASKINNNILKLNNKNISNNILNIVNSKNFLVNIKKNKLNNNKINNSLNIKKLKYKNINFNQNSFKKMLNILTKFNTELYFFNIKSLFNFKNLLLDKSLVFNIQKQKTKRYFDIMNKLKKRFNKK